MSEPSKTKPIDERGLISLYIELTGATEAEARAVVMRTCWQDSASRDSSRTSDAPEQDGTAPEDRSE